VNCIVDASAYDSSELKQTIVISSSASRCLKTAEKLREIIHAENALLIDNRLVERCMGSFEGRSREEVIKENPLWYNGDKFIYNLTPPKGESFESFFGRVDNFRVYLDEILSDHNVIVCSHNQTLKLLYSIMMNIKPNKIWYSKNFENGVLYKINNKELSL
jgi:broad specificity phosphatase PhoE